MTWRTTRLKHLCVDAGQYGLNVSSTDYAATGHRLIRTSDIDARGRLRSRDSAVYVDVQLDTRHAVVGGDLLVSRSGTLGRAMLLGKLDEPSTYAGYLVRFRPRPSTEPRFMAYVAASAGFQAAIKADAVTSTIQNFNAERYANITVRLPELDEQRRIADFLDVETGVVDLLMQKRTQQRNLTDELAVSVIDECIGHLGKCSKVRLGYVAQIQTGVTVDSGRNQRGDEVNLPYLRVANVQAGHLDLDDISEITISRPAAVGSRLKSGDVLMTEGGDLDKLGRGTIWRGEIEDCLHQNHVFAVRPAPRVLDPAYLALLTRASRSREYFESTGNKTTNLASTSSSKIRDFRIPLADLPTQRALVKEVDERLRRIVQLGALYPRQLALLAERRQALITAAVTGQIDVTTAGRATMSGAVSA